MPQVAAMGVQVPLGHVLTYMPTAQARRRHASRDFRTSAPRRRAPAVHRATTPRPCQGVSGRLVSPAVGRAAPAAGGGGGLETTSAAIGNRYSTPSTRPMAAAESRTAAASPRLNRAMSVRYKTAPAAALKSVAEVRD